MNMFTKKVKPGGSAEEPPVDRPRGRGRPPGPTLQGIGTRHKLYGTAIDLIATKGYDQTTVDISFPYEFDAAFLPRPRKWTLSPSLGWSRTVYEAANFIVDPTTKRRDTELRAGLLLDAPLSDTIGFSAQVQYSVANSNLPNFDTRNLSVLAGPTARF